MALSPLLTALRTKFTATGALTTAFGGGYHLDEAPAGTAMPYLVATVIGAPTDHKYGGVCRADIQIQFTGYGLADALLAAMETFCATFDEFVPTLSAGALTNTRRLGEPIPRLEEKDEDGNDVYRCDLVYEFNVRP